MEQFKAATGIEAAHVPYRGIAPALFDVIGGQVPCAFPGLAAALPHIRAGRLKPLAVTGPRRHALLPDVATLEEGGLAGFDGVQWYGIVGPARLPAPIVGRLNEAINAVLGTAELRERLSSEALEPMPMTPAQFAGYIERDIAKWTRLVAERKLELE
jgi:tripartite-type tricarboxylate transporter receptor subunit TctC